MVDQAGRRLKPSFLRSLLAHCDQHLEHTEPRVRSLVAGTLGALMRAGDTQDANGCVAPTASASSIATGGEDGDGGGGGTIEQQGAGGAGAEGEEGECTGLAVYCFFRERLLGAISSNFERKKETITDAISGAENVAVDDTSGWKALETSLLALKVQQLCCAFFHISTNMGMIRKVLWPSRPRSAYRRLVDWCGGGLGRGRNFIVTAIQ